MELPDLPIRDTLSALGAALDAGCNVVLVAPPGSGKTTVVPLSLLQAAWRASQRVLLLEPRRLATRAAATRMASLLGEPVGGRIGFRTRLDSAVSDRTEIEVVTEGLLVRRLQTDPGLEGVGVVILDEVHERSLESDLALALCLDLQRVLRPELRLVAMSATADGARLSALMNAEVITSNGRMFPVAVNYATRDISGPRDLPDAMARAVSTALRDHEGDVLAFLPGMAEIRRTQSALQHGGALVLPLHGELSVEEQDRALRPAPVRRVVLATSIAETSLTVPGVRIVVDGGWRRVPRFDTASGLTRLNTVRISRAAADQRAGRAGRETSGVAIRLWTQAQQRGLLSFDKPEILDAELSSLVLSCAAWGTGPSELPFLDRPSAGALSTATSLLTELGALDPGGRITPTGRRMAYLGAHPRLAAMMLKAASSEETALAADLAALLEERDPLRSLDTSANIELRLAAIDHADAVGDRATLYRIRHSAQQYRNRLGLRGPQSAKGDPGKLLAAAFPDRIAQRRGEPGVFRLSGGGNAKLPPTDPLAKSDLLVIASLEMKASARIRLAAALDLGNLPDGLDQRVTEQVEVSFDPIGRHVLARRRRRLGSLVLSDRTIPANPDDVARLLAEAVRTQRLAPLPWTEAARSVQIRTALMRGIEPGEGWPDLSDEALMASAPGWLPPLLVGCTKLADLGRLEMVAILRGMIPWPLLTRLDQELPVDLRLPGGRAVVDYTLPVPVASARAQSFYGMIRTPVLAGGRISLRLALLSPAGRPIAVTGDIGNFWISAWADVRREMRGRYPKHHWPENGGTGQ